MPSIESDAVRNAYDDLETEHERFSRLVSSGYPVFVRDVENIRLSYGKMTDRRFHRLILTGVGLRSGGARIYKRNEVLVIEATAGSSDVMLDSSKISNGETTVPILIRAETVEMYVNSDPGSLDALVEQLGRDGVVSLSFRRDARLGYGDGGWSMNLEILPETNVENDNIVDVSVG